MEMDKLYLNGNIHSGRFKRTNIPKQYISEVLNEHMNTNFQDLLNKYRVEEFYPSKKTTKNNQFYTYRNCHRGRFNSKIFFNAIFKKSKGLTPTQSKKYSTKKQLICTNKLFRNLLSFLIYLMLRSL
jgi:hypothetical protein